MCPPSSFAGAQIGDELHVPLRCAVDDRALVVLSGDRGGDDLVAGLARGVLAQADARDLGIRVGHLRHHAVVARARPAQDVVDDELRFVRADMREQQLAGRVAGGPHVAGCGAQGVVEHRVPVVELHPGGIQVVPIQHGLAAGRDQDPLGIQPVVARDLESPGPVGVARALDRGAREDRDPLGLQRGAKGDGRVLVLRGQQAIERLDDRDPCAEPGIDLRELDPDRSAADHDEGRRDAPVMPDRLLVRPIRAVAQPVDRRKRRAGPAREHDAVGLDALAGRGLELGRAGHPYVVEDHARPELGERPRPRRRARSRRSAACERARPRSRRRPRGCGRRTRRHRGPAP